MEKIKLVRHDTRPQLILSLTDDTTGGAIDISTATTVMKFRAVGSSTVLATLSATPIAGFVQADGTVITDAPYNVAGKGGRCVIGWTPEALSNPSGDYEGEIQITFSDGSIQTVYDLLKFKVREDF